MPQIEEIFYNTHTHTHTSWSADHKYHTGHMTWCTYIYDIAFQRMQSDSPHNDNNCVEYFGESASGGFTIKRDNGIFL